MFFDLAPSPRIVQPQPQGPIFSPREYVGRRAKYYGCSADLIRGPFRTRLLVDIRMAIARELRASGLSLPEIGKAMNRNHTTVLSLLRGGKRK